MRITAEFAVRRDDRNGHFYPSLKISTDITPEDEERLNTLMTNIAGVMHQAADQIEEIAQ